MDSDGAIEATLAWWEEQRWLITFKLITTSAVSRLLDFSRHRPIIWRNRINISRVITQNCKVSKGQAGAWGARYPREPHLVAKTFGDSM